MHSVFRAFGGGLVGLLVGWILAVNIVIFSGVDQGYEVTLPELFSDNPAIGTLAVVAVVAGLLGGGLTGLRLHRSGRHGPSSGSVDEVGNDVEEFAG